MRYNYRNNSGESLCFLANVQNEVCSYLPKNQLGRLPVTSEDRPGSKERPDSEDLEKSRGRQFVGESILMSVDAHEDDW
jgi:hypothetical protein